MDKCPVVEVLKPGGWGDWECLRGGRDADRGTERSGAAVPSAGRKDTSPSLPMARGRGRSPSHGALPTEVGKKQRQRPFLVAEPEQCTGRRVKGGTLRPSSGRGEAGAGPGSPRSPSNRATQGNPQPWYRSSGAGTDWLQPGSRNSTVLLLSRSQPLIDWYCERKKAFAIPLNRPAPLRHPKAGSGDEGCSPRRTLSLPGGAQAFPTGSSSAGQHPGSNQEGKLCKRTAENHSRSLQ